MITLYEIVEKETIKDLIFPNSEVLDSDDAIKERKGELQRALSLGNLEHLKTKIYFEDISSRKVVETTIWAITEDKIILKQGTTIPTNRIIKIQ